MLTEGKSGAVKKRVAGRVEGRKVLAPRVRREAWWRQEYGEEE